MCGNHEFNPGGAADGSWDQIWSSGALLGPLGPPKGTFWAKTGPFWAPGGPEEGRHQAKMCGNHVTNPAGPIGSSWDQIWPPRPSEDLRGPKKGPFGAKTSPFRGPRSAVEPFLGAKRAQTHPPRCEVHCSTISNQCLTHLWSLGLPMAKYGNFGPK